MPLGFKWRKKEVVEEEDLFTPSVTNTAVAGVMTPHGPGDRSDRREKGIDIDMIDPDTLISRLETLADENYELVDLPLRDDKGNIVFEDVPALDGKGAVILQDVPFDAHGATLILHKPILVSQPKMVKQPVRKPRPWVDAVLVYLNKVWPTIWMSSWEADTKKVMLRTEFYKIKKMMDLKDRRTYGILVDACRNFCAARLEDCKEGHKGLLMKVETHKLEVATNRSMINGKPS